MATHTTHYNLTKPSQNDKVNIGVLNDNADIIDSALYNKVDLDDLTADKVMLSDGVTSVEDELTNKQNTVSVYCTQTYSGTTSSNTMILSLQLPAGTYMVLPTGYVDGYGAYIRNGSTGTGWTVNGLNTITLTETTTLNIGPAASASTTWTNFGFHFLKIA